MRLFDATVLVVCLKLFGVLVVLAAAMSYWWLDKRDRWLQLSGAAGAGIVAAILVMVFIPSRDEAMKQAVARATGEIGEPSPASSTVHSTSAPTTAPPTSPTPVASDGFVDAFATTPATAQQATSSAAAPDGFVDAFATTPATAQQATPPTATPAFNLDTFDPTSPVKQRFTGKPYSFRFPNVPLSTAVQLFSSIAGTPLQVDPQKQNMLVTIEAVNEPWDKVLNDLLVRYNLRIRMVNGTGYVY